MAVSLPVRLTALIVDELDVQAYAYAYALIDPGATYTAVDAFLTSWLEAVDALTDGQILQGSITALPALPGGLKSAPVSGSRVEQNGILNFLATGTTYRWGEMLPALSNGSSVISGGKIVLTGGDPAANMIALLLGGSSIFEWTNANSQALASFKDSSISFRNYQRQTTWATLER